MNKEPNQQQKKINMKNILIYSLAIIFTTNCVNNNRNDCKSNPFDLQSCSHIDTNNCNAYFGDILFISPKDSSCSGDFNYNVIIAKLYCDSNNTLVYRLLDKGNHWLEYVNTGRLKINKQIKINSKKFNLKENKINIWDSSSFSKEKLPTMIVESVPVEM